VIVLALDTALAAATAVVARDGVVLAARCQPMGRGHQEAIATLTEAAMDESAIAFRDLGRIGVTVGPGSFTGLRVGLAFAKGLALAWKTPLVGIGSLEALATGTSGRVIAAIDAGRGQVYLQSFGGQPFEPMQLAVADAVELVRGLKPETLIGSGAPVLAEAAPRARIDSQAFASPEALAALTAAAPASTGPPQPLYLRTPDAKTLAERGVVR
jgi:tRNA threonylcarbamoyladenosine biosynthesis protein TsaB